MSDEELDRVFREKLQSYETTPSSQVWQNISLELRPQVRPKKNNRYIWMVAASLVVVVSLGLLLLPARPPIKLQASQVIEPESVAASETPKAKYVEPRESKGLRFLERLASMRLEGNKHVKSYKVSSRAISENIAHISQVQQVNIEPDINAEVAIKEPLASAVIVEHPGVKGAIVTPVLAIAKPEQADTIVHRSKIKSVGDIVNFVVRQVDPRKEKLIEFTNDENGTSVSSINLGLLKIRAKQNEPKMN